MGNKHFVFAGDYPLGGTPSGGVQSAIKSLVEGVARERGEHTVTLLLLAGKEAVANADLPAGINVVAVPPVTSMAARPRFIFNVPRLRKALRKLDPDAVNVIDNPAFTIACWPLAGKTAFTVHGIKSIEAKIWRGKDVYSHKAEAVLEKKNLAVFSNYIAISGFAENYIRATRGPKNLNITAIPNAVSSVFFERTNIPRKSSGIKIINVGTFSWLKSQHILLEALPALQAALPVKVTLTFIGNRQDPDYYNKLRSMAAPEVVFLENCPPRQIAAELADADLMIHTSRQDNQPMVFLEAMAAGTPILSSASGGVPEMLQYGTLGRLYPYGDIAGLVQAAVQMLHDRPEAASMALRASEYARNTYSPNVIGSKTIAFLESVAS